MLKIKSLQQRFTIFLLLPTGFLLLVMGFVVFHYARTNILNQWTEGTILKLSIAAHEVDMRLGRPKDLLAAYHSITENYYSKEILDFIVEQLRNMKGVAGVELLLDEKRSRTGMNPRGRELRRSGMYPSGRMSGMWNTSRLVEVTPPHLDIKSGMETVNLIVELHDNGKKIGEIKAAVEFDFLIENIISTKWWRNHQAYLVDESGKILASTEKGEQQIYRAFDELEQINKKRSGAILGPGQPPSKVTGFYKLKQAPWTLIVEAPGREVLGPLISFRSYFVLITIAFVLLVLLVMRISTGRTAARVKAVANAADLLAQGHFSEPFHVQTIDEVGELTHNFNTMMIQLKERAKFKSDLSLASEVQRSLLPKMRPDIKGVDISGRSIYCDETGGDYFDFLTFGGAAKKTVSIVVGDVSGHGIPSALLMATVRGLIRQRASMSGDISKIMEDVNCQVANDVEDSGQFMTAYYGMLDIESKTFNWVNAGHDAAIVYDMKTEVFSEFGGRGLALGLTHPVEYKEQSRQVDEDQIIFIGTDGIWETRNAGGEFFGKERLLQIIKANGAKSAEKIIDAVAQAVSEFRQPMPAEDDLTLVVVKINKLPEEQAEDDFTGSFK